MDNSLAQLVENSSSVLILLPTKPYFDQVAAGLSLYLSLKENKEASISCPSPMTVGFNRLIGVDKISEEVGNKNLVIKFAGYDATNIEKVSYDIENGEFKLTVVPKSGFTAPEKTQLDMKYSGVAADLVILIGGANDSHFPLIGTPDFAGSKIVHVGTRVLNTSKEIMSLAKAGSTTSEIVASLIKENGFTIDPDIATNLVMGIEEGSSHFENSDVRAETFEMFAYLLRSGGKREQKMKLSPGNFPPGAIPAAPFNFPPKPQPVMAPELDIPDVEGTKEEESDINPPDDWLQPKVFKGTPVS